LPKKLSQYLALPLLVSDEESKNKRMRNSQNLAIKIQSKFGLTLELLIPRREKLRG